MTDNMLKEGMKAPAFEGMAVAGGPERTERALSLGDYAGRKLVLYFYPRDNTPGCTREAEAFRDLKEELAAGGADVVGVSKDSLASHRKFSEKLDLPFPLLSDPDLAAIQSYGVWQEKTLYGKVSMGIVRSTFLIDETGIVRKIWRNVKVDGHAQKVREAIEAL